MLRNTFIGFFFSVSKKKQAKKSNKPPNPVGIVLTAKNCYYISTRNLQKTFIILEAIFMSNGKEYKETLEQMALVTQLGLTMAGSIIFCFFIGYFLDKWLHTKGIFLVIFILLGVFGGGWTVYRQIMAMDKSEKKDI